MKYQCSFKVKSAIRLHSSIQFERNGKLYSLLVTQGVFDALTVTINNFPSKFLPTIRPTNDPTAKYSISIPKNEFIDDIISELRTIEGALSVWGVERILFDSLEEKWIPETEEERNALDLFSFSSSKQHISLQNMGVSPADLIVRSILFANQMQNLEIPLAFYRKGKNALISEQYITAIYELFFVLESLFGNGKFKSEQLSEEFLRSEEISRAISRLREPKYAGSMFEKRIYDSVKRDFWGGNKDVIEKLVKLRGFLHHHTSKRKGIWHPEKQEKFLIEAWALQFIVFDILMNRINEVVFDKNNIADFLATPVTTDKGERVRWNGFENWKAE
jgi:hypothetical protein